MQLRVISKEGFQSFVPEPDAPRSANLRQLFRPYLLPCRRRELATLASWELGRAGRVCHRAAALEPRTLSFLTSQQLCPLQQLRRGMRKSPRHRRITIFGPKRFIHAYGHPAVASQQQVAKGNAPALTGHEILALSFAVGVSSRRPHYSSSLIGNLGACPNSGYSILSEFDSTLGYEQVFSPVEYRSDAAAAAECAGLRAERPCLAVYR